MLDADPLGQMDAAPQLNGGMADAASKGTKASLPGGTYKTLAQVTQPPDLLLEGDGRRFTRIKPQYQGAEAWVMGKDAELRDVGFWGVPSVGGIRIDGPAMLRGVRSQYFSSGFIFNSTDGHITMRDCEASNNRYGLEQRLGNGDHLIEGGAINGNALANIGIPASAVGSFTIRRTHLGFAPWGIYQEAGPSKGFMIGCLLEDVRFEAVTLAAMLTDNWGTSGTFNGNVFINCMHSWSNSYPVAGRTRDYAVKVGYVDRANTLIQGSDSFKNGPSGWLYVDRNYARWFILGEDGMNTGVTVRSGHADFLTRLQANGTRLNWN